MSAARRPGPTTRDLWMFWVAVVLLVAMLPVGLALKASKPSFDPNVACHGHDGVSQAVEGGVVCRDGLWVAWP